MFQDRIDAGRQLADALTALSEQERLTDPVILALPRGGVPVAYEVAARLKAPLDLVLVRKIGVPYQPELAAGAVVNGESPQVVVNESVKAATGMTDDQFAAAKEKALAEIAERRALYLRGRSPIPIAGRTAVLIDDGVATGATTRAAIRAVRLRRPAQLVLAVPVAAADTLETLRAEVDRLICVEIPPAFFAVGAHYAVFDQTSDVEVVRLLDAACDWAPAAEQE